MEKFESKPRILQASCEEVYAKLSNIKALEQYKQFLPADKAQSFTADEDSITFEMPPVGSIKLQVTERVPNTSLRLDAVNSPLAFYLMFELKPLSEAQCEAKLSVHAELNFFLKGMVQGPINQALEKLSDLLDKVFNQHAL